MKSQKTKIVHKFEKMIINLSQIGPGYWNAFHLAARWAQDTDGLANLYAYMQFLQKHFPCETCRVHIEKFFTTTPIEKYKHRLQRDPKDKFYVGPFRYTWEMHNMVNQRLHKPIMSWETAYATYFDVPCTDFCAGIDDLLSPEENPKEKAPNVSGQAAGANHQTEKVPRSRFVSITI